MYSVLIKQHIRNRQNCIIVTLISNYSNNNNNNNNEKEVAFNLPDLKQKMVLKF